jgi:hypothetical protein
MGRRKQPVPRVPITIRLPEEVVRKIDHDLERRPVPASRNSWLFEAAIEKLRKSGPRGSDGEE